MIWRNLFRFLLLQAVLFPTLSQADSPVAARAEDSIGPAIAGEFAFQSGHYVEAAQHYLLAAQRSPDLALAVRATRLAVLSGDDGLLARALQRWKQLAPEDPARAGLTLRLALRQGQVVVATVEAERLLGQGSDGLTILGDSLDGARGAAAVGARQLLRELVSIDRPPESLDTWLAVADIASKLNEKASAQRLLVRLSQRFPSEPRALLALAAWQGEQGEEAAVVLTLARLVPALVVSDADRRQIAAEYLQLRQYAQAERWLAAMTPDATIYRQRLAMLGREKNDVLMATLVAQVRSDRGLSPAQRGLLLGLAAELGSDWREAERRYRDVRSGPERGEAQLRLAFVVQKLGRDDDAVRLLHALQRDAEVNADARRDAYALEAQLLATAGNDADIDAYGRGLGAFKDDQKLLYGRAMRLVDSNRVDAGLADLRRILDREPEHAAALNAYGYTLATHKRAYAMGLPHVEQALRLQPDSPAVLDSLGYIRFKLGQHAEALPLLQRAWKRQPDPEIAAHLGELLWLMDRRGEAGEVWRKGLALEPGNPVIRSLQEQYRP